MKSFRSFHSDVSGGISGWSQPLLALALRDETFVKFIKTLTRQLVSGTAPGREMLTSSLLTPLAKPDGGVRPIACPDLIYRLCAKTILASASLDGALLPFQLGLGSPGGVEPIAFLAQQVAEGKIAGMSHIASVDLKNAYGSMQRGPLARATREHAPGLYRLAKFRYEHEGAMVIASNGEVHVLPASDGVYQGDPLAGLLFCVGVRPVLAQLLAFLEARGFTAHILCYLDDWYIFGDRAGILDVVQEFFDDLRNRDAHCGLELNLSKSWELPREHLLQNGAQRLGTMIGGPEACYSFLRDKVSEMDVPLRQLQQLHKQDAQLLLRRSLQHQLRHLQRMLPSAGLETVWVTLDTALHHALRLIRDGAVQPRRGEFDTTLFQLPIRLGGLGVPKHEVIAPHARAAMEQSSLHLLRGILPALFPDDQAIADGDDTAFISQATRVAAEYARMDRELMGRLSIEQAMTVVGNGSRLGSACLHTFPSDARTTLSDRQVQVLLHNRTLVRSAAPVCSDCSQPNTHGHDDDCSDRSHRRTVRHDTTKFLFVAFLRRCKGTVVNAEPRIEAQSMRRTDWRVHGPAAAAGGGDTDYDITFISATNSTSQRAPDRAAHLLLAGQEGMRAAATKRLQAYLDVKAQHKSSFYNEAVPTAFVPLVFSLDGAEHPRATAALKQWRSLMPSFSYLVSCVSVVLARTRAETFRLV
ncbi:hypothetical protein A4X13_0g8997 [Tilletia indica]|uniref:Reverse transcriptase domain-containing protein n=1 Tax=Tilletia indica TaxID=43049 RepID=A0A8T8SCF4_9BASI|nr:hypothetical protein A4X13_0g8997 [Tilletia indica]